MKRLLLAAMACALVLPASASARIDALDPSAPGSPLTAAQAIAEVPAQVTGASLPERAFDGAGAPSPLGVGNKLLDPDPKVLTGFPTHGDTYGILSSGEINTIASELTNTAEDTSFEFPDQFVPMPVQNDRGPEAQDWTVLRLDVNVPAGANCMALDYRFASEEFPEFVGSSFNDAFIAEIDSTSWSVADGGVLTRSNDFAVSPSGNPISINGVGDTAVLASEANGTYFDAATGLITTKAPIASGAHQIHLSIFDASDESYDSAVFLDNLRFIAEDAATCKPPTGQQIAPPPPPVGQPPAPPAPPAPPSNAFTPGPSVKFGAGGTQATLTVNVPGPGTLTAGSTSVGAAAAVAQRIEAAAAAKKGKKKSKKKVKKPLVKTTTVRATKAGPVKITVKLSGTGKALLAKKRKLTVPITLTFTPDGGTAASQVKSVTFKKAAKSCKKAKGKAKGSAKKKCKAPAKGKAKKK